MLLCAYSAQAADRKDLKYQEWQQADCPCQGCIDTGIPGKQHPYTPQEKLLAKISLQLASILCNDVRRLVLEYALDEDREWIDLRRPIVGTLKMPMQKNEPFVRCAYIGRYVDVLGMPQIVRERLMNYVAQFNRDDISALTHFFEVPKKDPYTLYSRCKRYRINVKKHGNNGDVCVEGRYHLDTFARIQGYINYRQTKEARLKNPKCCIVL
jgi:hypothetical protein